MSSHLLMCHGQAALFQEAATGNWEGWVKGVFGTKADEGDVRGRKGDQWHRRMHHRITSL